jgi:hypothetical protein
MVLILNKQKMSLSLRENCLMVNTLLLVNFFDLMLMIIVWLIKYIKLNIKLNIKLSL